MGFIDAGERGYGHVHFRSDQIGQINLRRYALHLVDLSWIEEGNKVPVEFRAPLLVLRILKAGGVFYRPILASNNIEHQSDQVLPFFKFILLRGN